MRTPALVPSLVRDLSAFLAQQEEALQQKIRMGFPRLMLSGQRYKQRH